MDERQWQKTIQEEEDEGSLSSCISITDEVENDGQELKLHPQTQPKQES
jgi:hypothetical protein